MNATSHLSHIAYLQTSTYLLRSTRVPLKAHGKVSNVPQLKPRKQICCFRETEMRSTAPSPLL